ncbi:1107_t:CDS:1, partial [Scutellospora calospora]
MSNENMPSIYTNPLAERLVKGEIHNYQNQDSNAIQQMYSLHNESQDLINKNIIIIDELCKLYNEAVFKGSYDPEIIYLLEQYLASNQLKPTDLINLCLNNQNNS